MLTGELADLLEVINTHEQRVVWLVGAAVSALAPSSIPAAAPAVGACMHSMFGALRHSASDDSLPAAAASLAALDPISMRLRVPLETLLEALDAFDGSGVKIASLLGQPQGAPNALHRALAARVSSGRYVLTTNFDECIESAGELGPALCWVGDEPLSPKARLLKLHGTASEPQSLRHTLRRVDRGFSPPITETVRRLTSGPVVVLGYAGADYDVLDLLSKTGDRVEWLQLPGEGPPPGACALSATREVRVIHCRLEDFTHAFTGQKTTYEGNDTAQFQRAVGAVVDPMPKRSLLELLTPVVDEAAVSFPECEAAASELLGYLRHTPYKATYLSLRANRTRQAGSPIAMVRTAALHLRLAHLSPTPPGRWRALSDAADALDGWFYGQGPIIRRLTYRLHLSAAQRQPDVGWLWFRAARSARARGLWDLVRRLLAQSMATDLTTWERAHCHRMMAMALAAQGCDFEQDLVIARRLFDYGSRTQASADVLRTEAACALLSGDRAAAQQRLIDAIAEHRSRGQRQGAVQSTIVLTVSKISPRLARRFVTL